MEEMNLSVENFTVNFSFHMRSFFRNLEIYLLKKELFSLFLSIIKKKELFSLFLSIIKKNNTIPYFSLLLKINLLISVSDNARGEKYQ